MSILHLRINQKDVPSSTSADELQTWVPNCELQALTHANCEITCGHDSVGSRSYESDVTTKKKEGMEVDELKYLEQKITQLDKRLERVEASLLRSKYKPSSNLSKSELATSVEPDLITGIPMNESVLTETLTCFHVVKSHRFATFQSLLLLSVIVAMVSFGITQFLNVDESEDSLYKPLKIESKDEYYLNEELEYTIPNHYFLFHLKGWMSEIPELYREAFDENCEGGLESCLTGYLNAMLDNSIDPVITASCDMVAPNEDSGLFDIATIALRNLSIHGDQIGTVKLNGTGFGIFGVLLKLEFDALATHWNGPLYCILELNMLKMRSMLPKFVYDIYFLISRSDEDSGLTGSSNYIDSWSKLWRSDDVDIFSKNFVYVYDESIIDRHSSFQAEIYVEKSAGTRLTLETYPNPTIVHYVSYNNYSYMDWMADMGGFLSIAIGFFVFMATRISKLANRGEVFHTHHGILPLFSLPHRNAEELARLRFIVLDAIGVTVQEYFGKSFQRMLTTRINSSE